MFGPAPFIGGGFDLTFLTSATSGADTIDVPSSTRAGDLLVLGDMAGGASTPSDTTPTGFTQIATGTDGFRRISFSCKIADSDDASSTLTGMTGANGLSKLLLVFRPTRAIASISIESAASSAVGGDPSGQTVTSGSGTAPLIVLAHYAAFNPAVSGIPDISPRSMTPAKDGEQDHTTNTLVLYSDQWIAWKFYKPRATVANVDVDMEADGSLNCLQSCYIELS